MTCVDSLIHAEKKLAKEIMLIYLLRIFLP